MSRPQQDPASFRDPSGHIFYCSEGVYRSLNKESYGLLRSFLQSPAYAHLLDKGLLIPTDLVDDATQRTLAEEEGLPDRFYVQHKKLWFISYPYEWTTKMLVDAARCTLLVQATLMEYGFGLKDASAYNVQFDFGNSGPAPIFIDLGSMEPLSDTRGLWLPYKQFVSHFLLPLLYHRDLGYDFKGTFLSDLEGFDPELAFQLAGPFRRLLPRYLTLVSMPHWLRRWEGKGNLHHDQQKVPPSEVQREKSRFILRHTVRSLQRKIDRLGGGTRKSGWVDYEERNNYSPDAEAEKQTFLHRICEQLRPKTVLDIGCNTGHFSFVAAQYGAKVLALDRDLPSLDRLYRSARERNSSVLPLRIDISNPSPGIGWRNEERTAFLDRVKGFECVFATAVVHHLLATNGIPLSEVANLCHQLTTKYLVVELVDPTDPMFRSLLRGRDALYAELSLQEQERIFTQRFAVLQSHHLTGMGRKLYLMERR